MKNIAAFVALACLTVTSALADTIALWTFESNVPQTITGFSNGIVQADFGSGSFSGHHASGSTVFSDATGNGSAHSIAANRWAIGDYWLIQVSTLGYRDLQLSFDQAGTVIGPTNFTLAWSLDALSFSNVLTGYQVFSTNYVTAWDPSTANPSYTRTLDLSSQLALNDAPNVYFRLRGNQNVQSQFTATTYGFLDNILVSATPIPEPGVAGLMLSGAILVFVTRLGVSAARPGEG